MSLGNAAGRAARIAGVAGGVALTAIAFAQTPKPPVVPVKGTEEPARFIPLIGFEQIPQPRPVASGTVIASTAQVNGDVAFPQMLAEARTAYGKIRDYTCHLVRQEKVGGQLLPEQTCELRVRTQPFSVNLRITSPKNASGEETSYLSQRSTLKVQFRAAGIEGIKNGYVSLAKDDPKTLANSRHTVAETGLAAVLDRIERVVAAEKQLNNPIQILVEEYSFGGKPCTRFEVYAERPHTHRYAYRCVLFVDRESKLPVRWEAYDQPRPGGPVGGDLIEVQSFIGIRLNNGLGESTFDR